VVDLYEIDKMRRLQKQNMSYNKKQLKKRGEKGITGKYSSTVASDDEEREAKQIKKKKHVVKKDVKLYHPTEVEEAEKEILAEGLEDDEEFEDEEEEEDEEALEYDSEALFV